MISAFGFWSRLAAISATKDCCDGVLLFSTGRAASANAIFKPLILHDKMFQARDIRLDPVAQPSGTICVFFAQHLFEIAQTGL
ncbi:MAG: hypothetical protein WBD33_18050 [Xanthobacteraceae bacterium]